MHMPLSCSAADVMHALHNPQLTVSPDGKYAFAMIFGPDFAYYEHPYVVVVDIHSAMQVGRCCSAVVPVEALFLSMLLTASQPLVRSS